MDLTSLGLTKVAPGESLFENGGAFTGRDRDLIDRLLRLGAKTHRHTGAGPIANPTVAPTLAISATGGALPSDTPIYATYTALDGDGGETLPAPAANDTTPAGLSTPAAPTAVVDYTGGTLVPNTYYYVLTGTDDSGGETEQGDPVVVLVDVGHPNARIILSGLLDAVTAIGATGWRLYRATNGGTFGLLAQGATNGFTDDGSPCLDPQVSPPDVSTTGAGGSASITVPAVDLPVGTVSYRIYASESPTFDDPSLLGEFPVADAGTAHVLSDLGLQSGAPPAVSTSLGTPSKVSATSEIDWTGWADPGGGGGGGGPRSMFPAYSMNGDGSTPSDAALDTYGLTWRDKGGHAMLALYSRWNEAPSGSWTYVKEFYSGTPYSGADWTGDTGAWTWNAGTNELVATGVWDPARIVLAAALTTGEESYSEVDYTIHDAGWEHLGVGVEDTGNATQRVQARIDRAAGTLAIVAGDGTVLASIGAAEGYTPPAVGDSGYVVLRRRGDLAWAWDGRVGGVWVEAYLDPANVTLPPGADTTRAYIEAGWTVDGAIGVSYFGNADVHAWQELVFATYHEANFQTQRVLAASGAEFVPATWAASINADGTIASSSPASFPAATPTITHSGAGVYVFDFSPLKFDGTPIPVASDGGVVSAVSDTGFTVTFGADTAFHVIVQS